MNDWLKNKFHTLEGKLHTAEELALRRMVALVEHASRDGQQRAESTRRFFRRVIGDARIAKTQMKAYIASDEFEAALDHFAQEIQVDFAMIARNPLRDERVRLKVLKVSAAITSRVGSRAIMAKRLIREPRLALALAGFFASQELFDVGQKAYSAFRANRRAG